MLSQYEQQPLQTQLHFLTVLSLSNHQQQTHLLEACVIAVINWTVINWTVKLANPSRAFALLGLYTSMIQALYQALQISVSLGTCI